MALRNCVSFTAADINAADLDGEDHPAGPGGYQLAADLAHGLSEHGYSTTEPRNRDDYAWEFDVTNTRPQFWIVFGHIGDAEREWMLFVRPVAGFRSLMRGRGQDEHRRIVQAVDAAVKARFTTVRWYTEREWDTSSDTTWSDAP